MSYNTDKELSLKVVMNKEKTKVIFAEANSDFINVLLSFLALPLGEVVKILSGSYGTGTVPGSLYSLYAGVSSLDETYFCVRGAKKMLLNPQSSFRADLRKLALDISNSPPNEFFVCPDIKCRKRGNTNISLYSDIATCDICGKSLTSRLKVGGDGAGVGVGAGAGAFTVSPLSFIITDDFRVAPLVAGTIRTLANLGIADTLGAEIAFSRFGIYEIGNLLKLSLISATPLTDLIRKKTGLGSTTLKPEPGILLNNFHKNNFQSRKMGLKVCLQRSTNRFLFAEAMDDFVEFLVSFLIVPLGGVEFLLGGNTGLTNIDNLYRSVSNGIDKKYFTTPETKSRLINPKIRYGYGSNSLFLPLTEDGPPKLYYHEEFNGLVWEKTIYNEKDGRMVYSFKSSKEFYVKKQTMCIVKDDLTPSPSFSTSISILNALGIPLSDVKDVDLHIGFEEALSILKAALSSKTPLTDALVKPMLNKLPKLEREPKQEP